MFHCSEAMFFKCDTSTFFSREFLIVLYQNKGLEEHLHEVPITETLAKEYLGLSREKSDEIVLL